MKKIKKKIVILFVSIVAVFFISSCDMQTVESHDYTTKANQDITTVFSTSINTISSTKNSTTNYTTTKEYTTHKITPQKSNPNDIYDSSGFVSVSDVIPDVILDIRYASKYNFVGDRINGYEDSLALLTYEAAEALSKAAEEFRKSGYGIKIYDAYRPQVAVEHFVEWSNDLSDTKMKKYFYPDIDKSALFGPYIAYYSGHSRGCTVDITLYDLKEGKDLDMGGTFDYFGELSNPDYIGVSEEQYNNRMYLRKIMEENGFSPCSTEWWDFTLIDEPYPNTYFSFPVSKKSIIY